MDSSHVLHVAILLCCTNAYICEQIDAFMQQSRARAYRTPEFFFLHIFPFILRFTIALTMSLSINEITNVFTTSFNRFSNQFSYLDAFPHSTYIYVVVSFQTYFYYSLISLSLQRLIFLFFSFFFFVGIHGRFRIIYSQLPIRNENLLIYLFKKCRGASRTCPKTAPTNTIHTNIIIHRSQLCDTKSRKYSKTEKHFFKKMIINIKTQKII